MKHVGSSNKLRGGYYTPAPLADFIAKWAIRSGKERVLEPSCGDGAFLAPVAARIRAMGMGAEKVFQQVTAVELCESEARKAMRHGACIICQDFFTYYESSIQNRVKYDVVLGNPPYIRYQNFDKGFREIAMKLAAQHGFNLNRLSNIWLPFVLLSSVALNDTGRLGMVLPAELLQVDYAGPAREFICRHFEHVTVITFKNLIFEGIQQEVVVLLAEKKSTNKGIRILECDSLESLPGILQNTPKKGLAKQIEPSNGKWIKYFLTQEELDLMHTMNESKQIENASSLFEINVGLVSGENDFFVLNARQVEGNSLAGSVEKIISKTDQLRGLVLRPEDFDSLVANEKKVFLFSPSEKELSELTPSEQRYIQHGELEGYSRNYKCRIRKKWYHITKTWKPQAFIIRQANLYPRIILNACDCHVTDTIHKIRFISDSPAAVAAAFLNSYTLALAETLGRSYGGGVLTFEPGEIRQIRIPMIGAEKIDFDYVDSLQRKGDIHGILNHVDPILLQDGLGLDKYQVQVLRGIWQKLSERRLARKLRKRITVRDSFPSDKRYDSDEDDLFGQIVCSENTGD